MSLIWTFLLTSALTSVTASTGAAPRYGCVDFQRCIAASKYGQREERVLQQLQQQLVQEGEQTQRQLRETEQQLSSREHLDSLSASGKQALRQQQQQLQEKIHLQQLQHAGLLNQAQGKVLQAIEAKLAQAAEQVAEQQALSCIISRQACFFVDPQLDVTEAVIAAMDAQYACEQGKKR